MYMDAAKINRTQGNNTNKYIAHKKIKLLWKKWLCVGFISLTRKLHPKNTPTIIKLTSQQKYYNTTLHVLCKHIQHSKYLENTYILEDQTRIVLWKGLI